MQREGWIGSVSGPPPYPIPHIDPSVSGRLDAKLCLDVQNSLLAAGVTRRNTIMEMLRVAASVNGGVVPLQETNCALRQLGLTKSSEAHLPGYLLKQMASSTEFVREGKGVYRMLAFSTVDADAVPLDGRPDHDGIIGEEPSENTE